MERKVDTGPIWGFREMFGLKISVAVILLAVMSVFQAAYAAPRVTTAGASTSE